MNKGLPGKDGFYPLMAHAAVHAFGTLVIMLIFLPTFWWLALCDFLVHGLVDRIKAVLTKQAEWSTKEHRYWIAFGMDQEAHNLTHLFYISVIVISMGGIMPK